MKEINLREFYPEIYKTDLLSACPMRLWMCW